jgi:TRAP-type uncharacterized transport system substrate-binding protein
MHAVTVAMALKKALVGLPLPLHAGAARYYTEVGLGVPKDLIQD